MAVNKKCKAHGRYRCAICPAHAAHLWTEDDDADTTSASSYGYPDVFVDLTDVIGTSASAGSSGSGDLYSPPSSTDSGSSYDSGSSASYDSGSGF